MFFPPFGIFLSEPETSDRENRCPFLHFGNGGQSLSLDTQRKLPNRFPSGERTAKTGTAEGNPPVAFGSVLFISWF